MSLTIDQVAALAPDASAASPVHESAEVFRRMGARVTERAIPVTFM